MSSSDVTLTGVADSKRIVIQFVDKGRPPMRTPYMPNAQAEEEFARVQRELEESGTEGDRWITVKGVMFRAREVFGMQFEALVLPAVGVVESSFWDRKF
jgi:hypothetical protein